LENGDPSELGEANRLTRQEFERRSAILPESLDALLQNWVEQQTEQIIFQVEAEPGDVSTRLLRLFELAVQDDGRVENAIRAWAVNDSQAATVVKQVEQQRLEYTQSLFEQLGFESAHALLRAPNGLLRSSWGIYD